MSKTGVVILGGMDGEWKQKEGTGIEPGSVLSTSVSSYLKSLAGIIYLQFPMSPQGNVPTTAPCVACWSQLILVLTPPCW